MSQKDHFAEGKHFVADLADALSVSCRAVESSSNILVYQLIRPRKQDFLIAGEMGRLNGGTTLARVRLFRDAKYDDGLIVSVSQSDKIVIAHTLRLFYEQEYPGIGFSYIAGPNVRNNVQLLRRHAA
jgi:hypothetical protein